LLGPSDAEPASIIFVGICKRLNENVSVRKSLPI